MIEAMMGDAKTWRWDSPLVGWNYRPMVRSDGRLLPLDLQDPDVRRRWLCDLVSRLPDLLGDFAHPTEVRVSARGKGEGACVVDWRNKEGPSTLLAFLQQAKTTLVHVYLDLDCLNRDLEPLVIPDGAELVINMWLDEAGSLDLKSDAPVYLRFLLNADIYAPRSFGDMPDNAFLAGLNGPRLTAFLERIERDVPAQFLDMDGERYGGLVGPRGFTAPANVFKDE